MKSNVAYALVLFSILGTSVGVSKWLDSLPAGRSDCESIAIWLQNGALSLGDVDSAMSDGQLTKGEFRRLRYVIRERQEYEENREAEEPIRVEMNRQQRERAQKELGAEE